MRVIGKLSPSLATQAAASLRPTHEFELVPSWSALLTALATRHTSAVVLEPPADDGEQDHQVAALVQAYPWIPIIAYTPCTPRCVRRVLAWSVFGVQTVVLYGMRDSVMHL